MSTEKEFLAGYDMSKYPRPSVTADVVAFMLGKQESENYKCDGDSSFSVLLVKRGGHPYKGCWALPGGFLQPGETIEECALREIAEETHVTPALIMPVGVFSEPGRDPRGWIISNAFTSIIVEDKVTPFGDDDACDARWFDVDLERTDGDHYVLTLVNGETRITARLTETQSRFGRTSFSIDDTGSLAFDHAKIIASSLAALRECAQKVDILFDFLPEKFTLAQLQKAQETITKINVQPANFRRKIGSFVIETDEYTSGAGHRPAKLYKRKTV